MFLEMCRVVKTVEESVSYMKELLSVEEQRHLKILEYLYIAEGWVTINRLSDLIGLSERMIKTDIPAINEQFNPFKILTSRKDGIKLEYPNYVNIDWIYRKLLSRNISFELIETIFFEHSYHVDLLAEKLYLSTSSCYRLITKINKEVQERFDIQISVKREHVQIYGEERKIRQFYYIFFSEKYTYDEWPFEAKLIDVMAKVVVTTNEKYQLNLNFADFQRVCLKGTINHIRLGQGFQQEVNPEIPEEVPLMILNNPELTQEIEESLGEKWTKADIMQLFSECFVSYFVYNYHYVETQMVLHPELQTEIQALKRMLHRLASRLEIPLDTKSEENIILTIYRDLRSDFKQKYFLYNQYFFCHYQLKNNRSLLEIILMEEVTDFTNTINRELAADELDRLIYYVTGYWDNMEALINQRTNKTKILIWTSLGEEHAKGIKNMIDTRFSAYVETTIYSDIYFKLTDELFEKYDLFVTNVSQQSYASDAVVSITTFPLNHDWRKIREKIQESIRLKNDFLY